MVDSAAECRQRQPQAPLAPGPVLRPLRGTVQARLVEAGRRIESLLEQRSWISLRRPLHEELLKLSEVVLALLRFRRQWRNAPVRWIDDERGSSARLEMVLPGRPHGVVCALDVRLTSLGRPAITTRSPARIAVAFSDS